MNRSTLKLLTVAAALVATHEVIQPSDVEAKPIDAYCTLDWHNSCTTTIEGPCLVNEHEGHTYVDGFLYLNFSFLSHEEGVTYERSNKKGDDVFMRDGHYTLTVIQD